MQLKVCQRALLVLVVLIAATPANSAGVVVFASAWIFVGNTLDGGLQFEL